MTTKRFTLFAIFMAAFALLVGCKKEKAEETPNATIKASVGMLQFQTSEDFYTYLENAKANNEKDGCISYGKMADDAYYSINPEEMFSDMDEVIDYVLEHRDLFQLILGSDGEYTVETRMYDHPFRNVANTDGIFQVGDTLYKIIEDGYVYTSVDKMDCLKQYDGNNYYQNTSDLKIYNFEEESEEMSRVLHPNTCYATELYDENTIGNNRITLRISIIDRDGPINSNTCQFGYRYYAKPYHRSLGWWGCNRTITANVNYVTVGIGGLFYITEEESVPGVSNLVHGGSEFSFEKYSNVYHSIGSGYHITSCSSTASTPDAGTVFVGC